MGATREAVVTAGPSSARGRRQRGAVGNVAAVVTAGPSSARGRLRLRRRSVFAA